MKRLFAFATCFVLIFCCSCSETDLETKYNKAFELIKDGEYDKAYLLFIELGDYKDSAAEAEKFVELPIQTVQQDDGMLEGIYMYYTTYSYNEYGECISREGAYENDEGPGFSEKNSYDEQGKLIKRETVSEAGESVITYEYDSDGKMVKQVGYTDGANVGGITTYTYNDKGLCESAVHNSYLGTDTAKYGTEEEAYHTQVINFYYDDNGRTVKMTEQYGDNYLYTYNIEYNNNSLPLTIVTDDGQGYENRTVFSYDDNGRCTKIDTDYDTKEFTYGDGELPISAVYTRDGGQPCDVTYNYKTYYLRGEKESIPFFMKEYLSFLEW